MEELDGMKRLEGDTNSDVVITQISGTAFHTGPVQVPIAFACRLCRFFLFTAFRPRGAVL